MPSMKALKETFEEKIGTPPKTAFASMILVASALVWGFYSVYFLTVVTGVGKLSGNEVLAVRGINLSGIVVAALLGVFLVNHVKKRVVFLQRWMLGGILLSLVPVAVNITGFLPSAAFFAITGIYFGLGMPVSLAYFSASTENENRSRLGGVIFLVAFFGIFLLGSLGITQIALNAFVLAGFEAAVLTVTLVLKPQEKEIKKGDSIGYRQILSNRSFLLYLVPWIMFIIIDFISLPIVNSMFPGDFTLIELSGTLLAGILAVVFGFFADYVGRKRLVVAGFALLVVRHSQTAQKMTDGSGCAV